MRAVTFTVRGRAGRLTLPVPDAVLRAGINVNARRGGYVSDKDGRVTLRPLGSRLTVTWTRRPGDPWSWVLWATGQKPDPERA